MQHDASFKQGDEVIRATLEKMAAEKELSYHSIDLQESHPGIFVYSLRGTSKLIALREREIRYAAEPETLPWETRKSRLPPSDRESRPPL